MVTVFSTFMLLSGCPDVSGVWGESSLQATVEKNSGRVKMGQRIFLVGKLSFKRIA